MIRPVARAALVFVGLSVVAAPAARAVIGRAIPLGDVLAESQFIILAKVERLDPDKPAAVLTVEEDLKGKAAFRRLAVNLTGDAEAKKLDHTPQLLKRLAKDLPLVLFVNQRDKNCTAFAYTNGTWFQLTGQKDDDSDNVRWSFTHCEPNLRGTFKGTTAELKQVILDGLSGKKAPPPPDPKEKPGLGPEVRSGDEADTETRRHGDKETEGSEVSVSPCLRVSVSAGSGPAFAVIGPGLAAPVVAVLAMLFPAVFGGLLIVLRRWTAALTVLSINSTLYLLYGWEWSYRLVKGTWWGGPVALWLVMTLVTVAGTLWAWRRHLLALRDDARGAPAPRRGEHVLLWLGSLALAGGLLYARLSGAKQLEFPWKGLWVLGVGVWGGTLYLGLLALRSRFVPAGTAALSAEGVTLGAMICAAVCLAAATTDRTVVSGEVLADAGEAAAGERRVRLEGGPRKLFEPGGAGNISSSPLVVGDRVYVGVVHGSAFPYGALYCLDRGSGRELWSYNKNGSAAGMKAVFSSPCLAGGRLYVGEGMHHDSDCRLFCFGADDGKLLWAKTTGSHTESSPVAAGGRVFIGAGDDGLYCFDAATGDEVWHFQNEVHIDGSPVVVGNRLYCGGGVVKEAAYRRRAVFCLDLDRKEDIEEGKSAWFHETDLPCLCAPAVVGDRVYFGLGNGDFDGYAAGEEPAGALLCVQAGTGEKVWRFDTREAVVTRPAADAASVYFGTRDGWCFGVARHDGTLRWKREAGSPVLASPVLARCSGCGSSGSLYVVGSAGRVTCLDPASGQKFWEHDLAGGESAAPEVVSTPAVVVNHDPAGDRRLIYFGAGLRSASSSPALFCLEDLMTAQ